MEMKRFGVSIPDDLLEQFDKLIAERGYMGRSEAIRDAMRMFISEAKWESNQEGSFASLNIVYHHKPALMTALLEAQHGAEANVLSTVHVHLTKRHCFEVLTIKGKKYGIEKLANKIKGLSGIEYAHLFRFNLPSDEGFEHHH